MLGGHELCYPSNYGLGSTITVFFYKDGFEIK